MVMSMTSKVHEDIPVSSANLTFTNEGISQDVFYQAISAYHARLPAIVDAGAMSISFFTNTSFFISPLTGPGVPAAELRQVMMPFLNTLEELGVNYQYSPPIPRLLRAIHRHAIPHPSWCRPVRRSASSALACGEQQRSTVFSVSIHQ